MRFTIPILLSPVAMTTSQFARIPLYNPLSQLPSCPLEYMEGRGREERGRWDPPGSVPSTSPFTPNGVAHQGSCEDREIIFINGHSMSPTSSTTVSSSGRGFKSLVVQNNGGILFIIERFLYTELDGELPLIRPPLGPIKVS